MNNTSKTLPIIFAVIGGVGVVGTAVVTAMDTPKASEALKALKESNEKLKPIDYIKWVGKYYWKSLVIGSASIASITSSTVISQKRQASLAATCMLLKSGYDKYKGKVKEVLGIEGHKSILEAIAKEDAKNKDPKDTRQVYIEENIGTFLADPEKVAYAYADLNQRLHCDEYGRQNNGEATLYDFLSMCEAELLDSDGKKSNKDIRKAFDNFGWTPDYLFENFEYCWIHMSIDDPKDGEVAHKICFFEDPILLPYNPEDNDRSEIYYPKVAPEGVENGQD